MAGYDHQMIRDFLDHLEAELELVYHGPDAKRKYDADDYFGPESKHDRRTHEERVQEYRKKYGVALFFSWALGKEGASEEKIEDAEKFLKDGTEIEALQGFEGLHNARRRFQDALEVIRRRALDPERAGVFRAKYPINAARYAHDLKGCEGAFGKTYYECTVD